MLELFSISGLLSAIVALVFGLLVLLKDPRSLSGQIFSLMILAFLGWSFSYWRWLISDDPAMALLWIKILTISTLLTPALFSHWILVLFNEHRGYTWFIRITYALTFTAIFLTSTNLIVGGVSQKLFFPFWPDAGVLYFPSVVLIYFGALIPAFSVLIRRVTHPISESQRGQALYILLGAVLGFGGGYTNVFLWFDIPIPPYGTFLTGFFPFFLAYAVIKHRLFKLKAIASEVMMVFISGVLLIQLILSESSAEFMLRSVFFGMSVVMGYVLVKSVYREVEQREHIEKLAQDLRKANERLKELDTLKSQFLSIASHDLRAPLTAIRNFLSLLLDGTYGKIPAAAEEGMRQIFDRATAMAQSVDSYLNVSRIEQGKMKYDFADADMVKIISDTADLFKNNAEEKGLRFTFENKVQGTLPIKADVGKLQEVFNNLIDNSIKYTPKGSVAVTLERRGNMARVTIDDTGVGMTEETQKNLFKLFAPGEDSRTVNPSSTGVGLYISKAHVEAHRGSVTATSLGKGKGSTFVVQLPLSIPR